MQNVTNLPKQYSRSNTISRTKDSWKGYISNEYNEINNYWRRTLVPKYHLLYITKISYLYKTEIRQIVIIYLCIFIGILAPTF